MTKHAREMAHGFQVGVGLLAGFHAGEEVLDVALVAAYEAAKVLEPGEEAFDLPAVTVATKGSSVLGSGRGSIFLMRCNELDIAVCVECVVEGCQNRRLCLLRDGSERSGKRPHQPLLQQACFRGR